MKKELYTVKQVAQMAGVGIKTLHHYDAIGLLCPVELSVAGYRLYDRERLERLQQILFYRELGLPLKEIGALMSGAAERLHVLREQRELLERKQETIRRLIGTIERTIGCSEKGYSMSTNELFDGFGSEAEWNAALTRQAEHLKTTYGYDTPAVSDVEEMNDQAAHAQRFIGAMSAALVAKRRVDDANVRELLEHHIRFLNESGNPTTAENFAVITGFFIQDDFHRDVLESQQPGLSYYLHCAARAFAEASSASPAATS